MPAKSAAPQLSALPKDHPARLWRPLPEVWRSFVERHPELAIGEAPSARSRYVGRHFDELVKAGVLVRTPSNLYMARADRFADVAWQLITGVPVGHREELSV